MATSAIFRKYAEYYELLNKDKPYKKEIEFVYKWAGKPNWIFDIGPGLANYWKYYPENVHLVGVEKSRQMVSFSEIDRGKLICADITKHKEKWKFSCATALFDVINYIPNHGWWKNLPLEKGGVFIFDIFDKKKVDKDGFQTTQRTAGYADDYIRRIITPISYDGKVVDLEIAVMYGDGFFKEDHRMYVWSHEDIVKFAGNKFKIEVKKTKTWQTWYKLTKR